MAQRTRKVALLRGINVGGKAAVPMIELASVLSQLGCTNVSTYLRTGNVIFDAPRSEGQMEEIMERAIANEFGLSVPVIVKSVEAFSALLLNVPFSDEARSDPSHVLLYLSKSPPIATAIEGLQAKVTAGEAIIRQGDEIWIHYPDGIGKSKITPTVIDRSIGSPATGRNWNTLVKLRDLAQAEA